MFIFVIGFPLITLGSKTSMFNPLTSFVFIMVFSFSLYFLVIVLLNSLLYCTSVKKDLILFCIIGILNISCIEGLFIGSTVKHLVTNSLKSLVYVEGGGIY